MKCPQCDSDVSIASYIICAHCGFSNVPKPEETIDQRPKSYLDKWKFSLVVSTIATLSLIVGSILSFTLFYTDLGFALGLLAIAVIPLVIYVAVVAVMVSLPLTWLPSALFGFLFDRARQQNRTLKKWQIVAVYLWSVISVVISIWLLSSYQSLTTSKNDFLGIDDVVNGDSVMWIFVLGVSVVSVSWIILLLNSEYGFKNKFARVGTTTTAMLIIIAITAGYMFYATNEKKYSSQVVPQLPAIVYTFDANEQLDEPVVKKSESGVSSTGGGNLKYSQVSVVAEFSDDESKKLKRSLIFHEMDAMNQPACSSDGNLPDFMQTVLQNVTNNDPLATCSYFYRTPKGINLYSGSDRYGVNDELYFRVGNVFFETRVAVGYGVTFDVESLATGAHIEVISRAIDGFKTTTLKAEEEKNEAKIADEKSKKQNVQEARDNAMAAVLFTPYGASGTDVTRLEKTKQYLLLKSPTKEVQAGGWNVSFTMKLGGNSSYSFYLSEVQQTGQSSACVGGQLLLGLGTCEESFTTPKGIRVSKAVGGGRYHYFVKDNIFFQMDATSTSSNEVWISTVIDRLRPI